MESKRKYSNKCYPNLLSQNNEVDMNKKLTVGERTYSNLRPRRFAAGNKN